MAAENHVRDRADEAHAKKVDEVDRTQSAALQKAARRYIPRIMIFAA